MKKHVYQIIAREESSVVDAKVLYQDSSLSITREEKKISERPTVCACGVEGPTPDLVIRKVTIEIVK